MRKQKRWAICALAAAMLLTAGCSGQAVDGAAGTAAKSAGQETGAQQGESAAQGEAADETEPETGEAGGAAGTMRSGGRRSPSFCAQRKPAASKETAGSGGYSED